MIIFIINAPYADLPNIICDKFGAKKRHTEKGSVLTFDLDKLKKIAKSYESETKIQVKLIEQDPDGYDGSDGFSKVLIIANEIPNAEITNNQCNMTDISEQKLKNNVNNTTEKHQDPSDVPFKPSDPSDPSANLDNYENNSIDEKQDGRTNNEIQVTEAGKQPYGSSRNIPTIPAV